MSAPIQIPPDERRTRTALMFGRAWLALAAALAIHVTDEALTDFLSVYNPAVLAIRGRFPWIPLPTFAFPVWLAGLIIGITILFLLGPAALRGARWLAVLAVPFSVLMIGNGLGHAAGSLYLGRFMPGVYSSPILVAAALLTLIAARRLLRRASAPGDQLSPRPGKDIC